MEKIIQISRIILLAIIIIPLAVFFGIILDFPIPPGVAAETIEYILLFSPVVMAGAALIYLILLPFLAYKAAKASDPNARKLLIIFLSIVGGFALLELFLDIIAWMAPSPYRFPCGTTEYPEFGYWEEIRMFLASSSVNGLSNLLFVFVVLVGIIAALNISWLLRKQNDKAGTGGLQLALISVEILIIASFVAGIISGGVGYASIRKSSINARRITDVKQIQLALELYWDGEGQQRYPLSSGNTSQERWQSLSVLAAKSYISQVPNDPCVDIIGGKSQQYDYASSPDGKTYVIRALLDDPRNSALSNDIDGNVLGIWCGEQGREIEYCLVP